jgi:hypothetical protein
MGALGTAKKDSFLVNSDPVSMFARGELLGRLQFTMDRREDVLDNVVSDHIKGSMMPRHGREANTPISVYGTLDFGSFRDLQRHRGGYVGLPLVTGDWGFHRWYVDNLPPALQSRAVDLVFNLVDVYYKKLNEPASLGDLVESKVRLQYMLPMGMIVPVDMVFPLRQLVYFIELRSGQTVHPTLRQFAHSCAEELEYEGVQLHYDNRPDVWTIRRGDQDIVERNQPTAEGA